jgi:hypothetical protein
MPLVSLIRPPSAVGRLALTLNVTPPLSVACLAGSLAEAGFEVEVVDAVGEGVSMTRPGYHPNVLINGLAPDAIAARIDPDTSLVAISCMFSTDWPVVREIIAAVDRALPGVPILCGGEHPTAAPEHALRAAPALLACALGEGEDTVVEVARAIQLGKSLVTVPGHRDLPRERLQLRRRPRPHDADRRDPGLPLSMHLLLEPADVDDPVRHAIARAGGR